MKPRSFLFHVVMLAPALLLAACSDDAADKGDTRTAAGEVLEGSISDRMIALDEVKSQAPLMKSDKTAADGSAEESDSEAEGAEADSPDENGPDPVGAAVEAGTAQ